MTWSASDSTSITRRSLGERQVVHSQHESQQFEQIIDTVLIMPRAPRYSDEGLRQAVADSRSLGEVCRRLGLRPGGGTYRSLHRHIARLGIDTAHLPRLVDGRVRVPRSWTDEKFVEVVRESRSVGEVQRRLGYNPSGGMHRFVRAHINRLGLSTDHFSGQGWARGQTNTRGFRPRPLGEVLVANSTANSAYIRRRLIKEGLKEPRCEICGLDTWRGEPLPLALDHINGDPCDNRLENLRILCPNCHALTDTWCGRKNGRRTPMQREQV